ncbi:MAG: helix-turn-helix domain-containing protein [Mycoplasma sp.]|nr:helix-turn-helix domain-containing protein [Mycoplasma sp.]
MIKTIIKENLEYWNIDQKQLSIRTGISKKTISLIINEKIEITPETSLKIDKVFSFEDLTLYKIQQKNKMRDIIKNDNKFKEITKYIEYMNIWPKLSKVSFVEKVSKLFKSNTLNEYKDSLLDSGTNFYKYKDKPLAYLWMALLENKFGHLKSKEEFKKSSGKTVLKGSLDILFSKEDWNTRQKKLEVFLDKHGIILVCAPFIKDSTINGSFLKKHKQRFIYISDSNKREYNFIFTLVHELCHAYFWKKGVEDNGLVSNLIRNHMKKYKQSHSDLEFVMNLYDDKKEQNSFKKEDWDLIYKNTKKTINFGDVESLFKY